MREGRRFYVTTRCPSVCLSVPSCTASAACGGFAAVGPAEGTIDCCTAPLQQVRPRFDSYPQQHGAQQQMRALSCLVLIHNRDCDSDDSVACKATATTLWRPCNVLPLRQNLSITRWRHTFVISLFSWRPVKTLLKFHKVRNRHRLTHTPV